MIVLAWIATIYIVCVIFTLFAGALLMLVAGVLLGWSALIRHFHAKRAWHSSQDWHAAKFDVSKWSSDAEIVRQIDLPDGRSITSRIPTAPVVEIRDFRITDSN